MAGGRIKGITIEIDGSTTGLDKALKSTESNLSSVQRSLKDVDRLLKIDPKNTELLSQKQKLLGQAVDDTKKKLESLKTASEQAAKTVGNYDAWKEAYTPIQEEINKTKEKTKSLKDAMGELEKAGKVDTSEYKDLQTELQNNEDHLKDLKNQAKEVSDEFGNPISHEQYDSLQREIIDTENQLKSLEKQAKSAGSVLGTHLQQAGEKMQEVGGKISDVGGKMTTHVSLPIAAAGAAIGKMSMDFEDSMAKVSTIADETEVPIGDMKQAIVDLSNQTGVSSTEIAENVYNAISAGQKTGDAVNFVSNATKLAKAGFAETGDALDILTTIMNAYGMEADDVTRVSDVLIQTQNLGKTTVAELSGAMGKVIPTAKSQGVQLEELAGAYAVMTSNGIATAETTTYLNSMLNELGKQGTTAADAFAKGTEHIKEGGLTMAEAMEQGWSLTDVLSILDEQAAESGTSIANMFGSAEAGKAANVLWDNASKVNDAVEQMGNSSGATETAFGKLETKSYTIEKSVNQLKNSATGLGETMMEMAGPIIEKVAKKIQEVTEWLNGLDEGTRQTIITVASIVAVVGPVLLIIGKVISTIGAITTGIGTLTSFLGGISGAAGAAGAGISLFSGPLLPVIGIIAGVTAAIAGLTAAGVALYKNWDTIKEKAGQLKEKITQKFSEIKEKCGEKISAFKEDAVQKFNEIKDKSSEKISEMKDKVAEKVSDIKEKAVGKFEDLKNNVAEKASSLKEKAVSKFEELKNKAKEKFDGMKKNTTGSMSGIDSITTSKMGNIVAKILSSMKTSKNGVDTTMSAISTKFSVGMAAALTTTADRMGNIGRKIASTMSNARSTVSSGIEKIKSKFNFKWKLPDLKLPHFSASGKFSLNPPSVPKISVKWYGKAMNKAVVMDGATAFGYDGKTNQLLAGGERGREVVSGEQHLVDLIGNVVNGRYDQLAESINRLNNLAQKFFPEVLQNMGRDIVLDDGTLVGKIAPKMDSQIGMILNHKERGN